MAVLKINEILLKNVTYKDLNLALSKYVNQKSNQLEKESKGLLKLENRYATLLQNVQELPEGDIVLNYRDEDSILFDLGEGVKLPRDSYNAAYTIYSFIRFPEYSSNVIPYNGWDPYEIQYGLKLPKDILITYLESILEGITKKIESVQAKIEASIENGFPIDSWKIVVVFDTVNLQFIGEAGKRLYELLLNKTAKYTLKVTSADFAAKNTNKSCINVTEFEIVDPTAIEGD